MYYAIMEKKGGDLMPASKAQQRAVAKYMAANYDEIKIRLPKGERDRVRAYAESQGQSVNALIRDLLQREMAGFNIQDQVEFGDSDAF